MEDGSEHSVIAALTVMSVISSFRTNPGLIPSSNAQLDFFVSFAQNKHAQPVHIGSAAPGSARKIDDPDSETD